MITIKQLLTYKNVSEGPKMDNEFSKVESNILQSCKILNDMLVDTAVYYTAVGKENREILSEAVLVCGTLLSTLKELEPKDGGQ